VRCPSDETGSASRDGAATAAALQPRLEEVGLTKPLPTPEEQGKQHRSAAAVAVAAMPAVAAPDENDSVFVRLGAWGFFLPLCCRSHVSASKQEQASRCRRWGGR